MRNLKNLIKPTLFVLTIIMVMASCGKDGDNSGPIGDGSGTGGSLARFTVYGEYLYTVDRQVLKTFNLADPALPELLSSLNIGMDIETIYPYNGNLFIGSMEAMYIYSLADPAKPLREAVATHTRACDPVVANGNYAYVTVRSGTNCGGPLNALLVFDVSNVKQPVQISQLPLTNPHGLGITGSTLYVCDGTAGLKVFDVSDPKSPASLTHREGYTFKDCIPHGDILVCMVEQGMVIYDITNPNNPIFVAEIN